MAASYVHCTVVAELTIVVSQLVANSATMQFQLGRQHAQVSNTITAPPSQQLKPGRAVRYLPDIPDFTTLRFFLGIISIEAALPPPY